MKITDYGLWWHYFYHDYAGQLCGKSEKVLYKAWVLDIVKRCNYYPFLVDASLYIHGQLSYDHRRTFIMSWPNGQFKPVPNRIV